MTLRSTNGGGVPLTEPIDPVAPAPAPVVVAANNEWEDWVAANDFEDWQIWVIETIGETLAALRAETARAIEKKIESLVRALAEQSGALSVLRNLGPPPGIRFRGSYDPNAEYFVHDIVAKNGSSFVALRDRPGGCPNEHWRLLAGKGDRGQVGPPGPRGMTGGRGEPAPAIKAWLVNKAKFTASPILTDGSVGAALELKGLFQEFLDQTRVQT